MNASPAKRVRFTPGTFLAGLIVLELLALLFSPLRWFAAFNHRAWTPLLAVEIALVGLAVLALWAVVARLRRGTFQFSLRALVLLIVSVAVPLAALAAEMRWAADSPERARYLSDQGAHALQGPTWRKPSPANYFYEPEWLAPMLGTDLFTPPPTCFVCTGGGDSVAARWSDYPEIERLSLSSIKLTDDGWPHLRKLTQLRHFTLSSYPASDSLLAALSQQQQLAILEFYHVPLDDQQLARLAKLPKLQSLAIHGAPLNGSGFVPWGRNTQLTSLNFSCTPIDAVGLGAIANFANLENLRLMNCKISADSISRLAPLPRLHSLDLANTDINADGVRQLTIHPNLSWVNLKGSALTDLDVGVLLCLPKITFVNLTDTRVSESACKRLLEASKTLTQIEFQDADGGVSAGTLRRTGIFAPPVIE